MTQRQQLTTTQALPPRAALDLERSTKDSTPEVALARRARRTAVLATLAGMGETLTLDRLDTLMVGKYGEELAELTVADLTGLTLRSSSLLDHGESTQDAVMRVFRALPQHWLSSSFFVRHLGLHRWTAQKLLATLAERGLLVRDGKTSGTRYQLAAVAPINSMSS